ncbi:MAG: hypothetical protein KAV82_14310 [Phycisphaerae bacterium]|nr:hypothetical protein [Phycisphaerae bacterium]
MDELNIVKNPRFAVGKKSPRSWSWCADGEAARWKHEPSTNGQADRVMLIESEQAEQNAVWAQTLRCKAGEHHRIEADIECDCIPSDVGGGLILAVQPYGEDAPAGEALQFAPVQRASKILTMRGYFKTPANTRRLEIRIGLVKASGWARVHDVRLMAILEVDACSHILAVPPPAYAEEQPPRAVRRVVVCGAIDACPSLVEVLQAHFAAPNVRVLPAEQPNIQRVRADAILIPGDTPPSGVRSVMQLEELARNRIVVISLNAFARLAKPRLEIKTVEQQDDPIHATVVYGCFITAGFALHDILPFAGVGEDPTGFAQRQFCTTRDFHDFRKRHRYEVFLTSVTNADKTMDKPIGLFKTTGNGAVIVCDLDALEPSPTTLGEPHTTAVLLLNMLGGSQHRLGQFVSPAAGEHDFHQELMELQARFEAYDCLGIDRSEDSVEGVVVRLGPDYESSNLLMPQRPAVVIRSGLCSGDEDGIYGTFLWLKRLVRPAPFVCPYTHELMGRFRVFWLPLHRNWNGAIGLTACTGPPRREYADFQPGKTRVVIDITAAVDHRLRVVFARQSPLFERCARALPVLAGAMAPCRFLAYTTVPGGSANDADGLAWRCAEFSPEVVVDEAAFQGRFHRSALEAGADLVRIELPRGWAHLTADSIRRSDLAAGTLEHVVGLACDGFVMNHLRRTIELDVTDVLGESCDKWRLVRTDPKTGKECAEHHEVGSDSVICLAPGTAVCV